MKHKIDFANPTSQQEFANSAKLYLTLKSWGFRKSRFPETEYDSEPQGIVTFKKSGMIAFICYWNLTKDWFNLNFKAIKPYKNKASKPWIVVFYEIPKWKKSGPKFKKAGDKKQRVVLFIEKSKIKEFGDEQQLKRYIYDHLIVAPSNVNNFV